MSQFDEMKIKREKTYYGECEDCMAQVPIVDCVGCGFGYCFWCSCPI